MTPLFNDSEFEDFSLGLNSPCINEGVEVDYAYDFLGTLIIDNPDIGAFEFK